MAVVDLERNSGKLARTDIALLQNGDVVSWGIPPNSPVQVPAGLEDVTAISAGSIHAAAFDVPSRCGIAGQAILDESVG